MFTAFAPEPPREKRAVLDYMLSSHPDLHIEVASVDDIALIQYGSDHMPVIADLSRMFENL
jgi:endonuclease/exonuclease/phosphatase family metal-dependent hydrolase